MPKRPREGAAGIATDHVPAKRQAVENGPTIDLSILTAWTPQDIPRHLPPLPSLDDELVQEALTHSASPVALKGAKDYEQLEFEGDSFVYWLATHLIVRTFKCKPGYGSHLRERIVCNKTFSSYFQRYNLDKRARFPADFYPDTNGHVRVKQATRTKVEGDMFEAYVGAVIKSGPTGHNRCSSWLKSLWAETLAQDIRKLDRVEVQKEVAGSSSAKERLNREIIVPGAKLVYEDLPNRPTHKHNPKIALFGVRLVLNGYGEQGVVLGFGSGLSKSEAGEKAATRALEDNKLMAKYREMKQRYMEARNRRTENQAVQQPSS
jgi:ribonuclease III